ncbi:hypothetical protein J5N97_029072 [Dioscorea zingiberensis]|uniref:Transcription factor MYBS1 n=1 Tax=Dioscorea zingiberensis TaxID=325984 RepID=A0A9D5BZY8_9LILI|nr:hypothetical protein J5N97_029072 [Dioscorea zingiberensis]
MKVRNSSLWSWEEDKAFEKALVTAPAGLDGWERVAAEVPGKTIEDVKCHFKLLMEDIQNIESGLVPLPGYQEHLHDDSNENKKESKSLRERRKGTPWTQDEHRLFLLGLDKFGKGDWRSISRHFVVSRTPTQVASHAQKYYNRLNSINKDRRRSSIHDITNVHTGDLSAYQGPITGQWQPPRSL